ILIGITTGVRDPNLTISTCGISLNFLKMYSNLSSSTNKQSPPESNTSLTSGVFLMYSIQASILSIGTSESFCQKNILLVQYLQYIEHWLVIEKSPLSLYL